jgi:DNA-binding SARP family transcriptional activator
MYIPSDIYEKIKRLKRQGKYQEALNIVNEYLKKDPTNEELLLEVTDLQYAM